MSKVIHKEIELAGRKLVLETGELAGHANGSVLAQYGETVVLATAVSQKAPADIGYFPLAVDFEEKLFAAGRISTSRFIKREGRPTETQILTGRLIDRSIRPLFPKDYQAEVQVIITVLSFDEENDPDIISLIAASAALTISDIPWNGPISGLKVGLKDGKFILNPTIKETDESDLDLLVASSEGEIVMIEAAAKEVDEKLVAEGLAFALKNGKDVLKLINDLAKDVGREKQKYESQKLAPEVEKTVKDYIQTEIMKDFDKNSLDDGWFGDCMDQLVAKFISENQPQDQKVTDKTLVGLLEDAVTQKLRDDILVHGKRPDGRKPEELREITIKVPVLPRTHGSAIFQRGETQVLSIATLASPALAQLVEGMYGESKKRYMHHYNFPPFSSGEVKRLGSPGRREIGHGALAEKALVPVIPATDVFPYTVRVVSECLSSAGSTSMASVCGSTLALMDAGVPLKEPVAGISIGLITDSTDKSKYVLLTDIAYQEDAQGDMDFKIAGTKNGITAIQMDIKLDGISTEIAKGALDRAKIARAAILKMMADAIPASRKEVSKYAPVVILVKIDPAKIGGVIGSGGRVINNIIATTGATVDVEDDGTVMISAKDPEAAQKAAVWVEGIVKEPQPGEIYEGPVTRILPFGAMVEMLPGKEGLVHVSKLAEGRVENVEDVVKVGDIVKVHVAEIDDMGRVNLSMVFDKDGKPMAKASSSEGRPERRGFGSRDGGGRFGGPRRDSRPPRKRY
ncbi:MAG: polyribonucleotide nucleotidyltransferase [Candidatus Curtissbacteria bacterium]|nr:polyribonucleotide nucleotidyltransferase [Candidatus Curtissbacteria bacterium]